MRKLKLQVQISIDGFIAGPNNEMDWMTWDWDDELKKYTLGITEPVDCILLGRCLAEGFIDAWLSRAADPHNEDISFVRKMNETPKLVFSNTLEFIEWKNTTLVNGNLTEEINLLKEQPGSDIIAYGGARFVTSLIQHDLIDEYHLFINPVAIGDGKTIFSPMRGRVNLELVHAQPYKCGITVLQYKPVRK